MSLRESHCVILDLFGIRNASLIILSVQCRWTLSWSLQAYISNKGYWKSGKFPLKFNRFSVESDCVLVPRPPLEILNFASPSFCCSSNIVQLSDTKNGINVDISSCLRPLIIDQYRPRPWLWWIFEAFHIQNIFRNVPCQLLRNVEYVPNIFKVLFFV